MESKEKRGEKMKLSINTEQVQEGLEIRNVRKLNGIIIKESLTPSQLIATAEDWHKKPKKLPQTSVEKQLDRESREVIKFREQFGI